MLTEVEGKYLYNQASPEEALEIMRNSFAHIGRINLSKHEHIGENRIFFLDYDNNELSGKISCNFMNLIKILNSMIDFTYDDDRDIQIRIS